MADDRPASTPGLDPDYLAWRSQQLAQYDRDYAAWRQSQAEGHDQDYRAWRAGEAAPPGGLKMASQTDLPPNASHVAEDFPALWAAYQGLGEAAAKAGPLEGRSRHLVHLAMALAIGSEGAVHSHVRRAMADGVAALQLEHVALLAVTTLGWPQAMRGLSWIRDVTRPGQRP